MDYGGGVEGQTTHNLFKSVTKEIIKTIIGTWGDNLYAQANTLTWFRLSQRMLTLHNSKMGTSQMRQRIGKTADTRACHCENHTKIEVHLFGEGVLGVRTHF